MSCIGCEEVPKRINNIFRDEELKEKFENLTGIAIFQNVFICDPCSSILNQSHSFKEKCIEVFEREIIIKYDECQPEEFKTEVFEAKNLLEQLPKDDSQLLQEEHLEEEETIIYDPQPNPHENIHRPKNRLRYTLKEKLEAIELAEQIGNRQAAKLLTIDESCIRKWRHQKVQIKNNDNQRACKVTKSMSKDTTETTQEMETECETEIECEIQTEIIDVNLSEPRPAREVRTRKSYSSGEKLQVVAYAEVTGNRQAAKIYHIDESCIRKWRNQKDMLIEIHQERGTRRKPNLRFPDVETRLKAFVLQKLDEGITLKPSEIKAESIRIAQELNIGNFKGTSSYIFKFMERYHFPSSRGKNLSVKHHKREPPLDEDITIDIV